MKKVLIGLVIALMMTGCGSEREISKKKCEYLLSTADTYVYNNIEVANLYAETWSALCD